MRRTGEAVGFLVAGVVNTGITLVLYWCLLLVLPYQLAYTLTYVAGIGLAYWLNTRFVFRVAPSVRTAAAYPAVYVVGYLTGLGALHFCAEILGWPHAVGIFVSILATIPVTFLLTRALLARSRRPGRPTGERGIGAPGSNRPDSPVGSREPEISP